MRTSERVRIERAQIDRDRVDDQRNGRLHSQCVRQRSVMVGLALGLASWAIAPVTMAQIIPDGSLGSERSRVNPNALIQGAPGVLIDGGARRGANLFQSFQDFNVGDLQRVFFANPAGVQNILGRVTGANPSLILGTLGVDGPANLFLLNPNGISFGANARLDLRGSFVASTGDRFDLGNGQQFSAVDPGAAPLIDVAIQPGIQLGAGRGDIQQAGNLAVGTGQTLALSGREVTLAGQLAAAGGTVQVLGDRVNLLGTADIEVSGVGGNFQNGGTVLVGGDFQGQGPVRTATQTTVNAGATIRADAVGTGNGGRVIVWADDNTQFAGMISARGGNGGGNGGFVEVSGKQTLGFTGRVDTMAPLGQPGTLLLDPFDFVVNQPEADAINASTTQVVLTADNDITFNARINIQAPGVGLSALAGNNIFVNNTIFTDGGAVFLRAENGGIFVRGANAENRIAIDPSPETGSGVGNRIVLNANTRVEVINASLRSRSDNTDQEGTAEQGAIGIVARGGSVLFDNATLSTTSTTTGNAGLVLVTASGRIDVLNSSLFSRGNEGVISLGNDGSLAQLPTPSTIRISNSTISARNQSPQLSQANAGDIFLAAANEILIENQSEISSSAGVPSGNTPGIPGNAGNITLQVLGNGSITLQSDSSIFSNTFNRGNAGTIDLKVVGDGSITLLSDSSLSSSTYSQGDVGITRLRTGPGGTITLNRADIFNNIERGGQGSSGGVLLVTGTLRMEEGSQVQTIVRGLEGSDPGPPGVGDAGLIVVRAADSVRLSGFEFDGTTVFPSGLRSVVGTGVAGDSGVILVQTPLLFLSNRAEISTSNFGDVGDAGYILASSNFIVLDRRARLFSVSTSGRGGSIGLETPYLVGVSRNSVISTRAGFAGQPGTGGDIVIGSSVGLNAANRLVQLPSNLPVLLVYGFANNNSDFLADAFEGSGGRIEIDTLVFRNLVVGDRTFITNDLDATSGVGRDGTVTVNSINLDPDRGLTPLSDRFKDPRLGEGCDPRTRQETSQLLVVGKGGAAQQYSTSLPSRLPPVANSPGPTRTATAPPAALDAPLQAAQGWAVDAEGTIRLVASAGPTPAVPAGPMGVPLCR
jgi:filamentous hemagglutinin family protein